MSKGQYDIIQRSRGMTLQSRFMLYFGAVVVTLMATVTLIVNERQTQTMLQQTEARGLAVAKSIAATVTKSLMSYDSVGLQMAAQNAKDTTGASYVIILNKENQIGGFSERPEYQLQRLKDSVSESLENITEPMVHRIAEGEMLDITGDHLDIAVPVYVEAGGVRWGTVRVGLSLSVLHAELDRTKRLLLMLSTIAVAIVLMAARIFTLQITRPLERLAHATAAIARGDLDHAVDEEPVGELRELARSFNKMTSDLKRSRDAIRYQNQHLENMVQERTAALREKARELEKANAELLEVDRLKSDFLSNVSHELRTPLTSIRSFTEIMVDRGMDLADEERYEFLGIVAAQAERLTRLISDLLDLSKIEAGEFHCHMETIDPHEFIDPCIETLRTIANEKKVSLDVDIPEELPAILGDRDRLQQVLTNLVDNAMKFTRNGGAIVICASTAPQRVPSGESPAGVVCDMPESGEYLLVKVQDNGVGIAPEYQQHIFDKFGQVGNVLTNKPQGTGLGLAISGNIMVQHSGALWVNSEVGRGSAFHFSVPVVTSAQRSEPAAHRTIDQPVLPLADQSELISLIENHANGSRILIVDDEQEMVTHLTETLEPLGFRALGCTSGRQAVAKAKDLRPDCIVLDANMPDLDGFDVLRLLKNDPATADIPVIVMSTRSDDRRAYELGATGHIERPDPGSELLLSPRSLV